MRTSTFYKQIIPLSILFCCIFFSCKKDEDGRPDNAPGTPTFTAITPTEGGGGTLLTLSGAGLGDIRSIVFDNQDVPTAVQPTLNTDKNILFRVPDTAFGGPQNIILTNSAGKTLSVPFNVIALPSVSDVSNYNFTAGTRLTLTGNNLDDVSTVTITGTSDAATIVSTARKTLVIDMPATNVNRGTLEITNASGTITTTQEFVNTDKALLIFTDTYGLDFSDNSWGDGAFISSDEFKSGTASVAKKYAKGNWHLIGFANWWPRVAYSPDYKYLSFWVKGASADHSLYVYSLQQEPDKDNESLGYKADIPANTWKYFKIPLSEAKLWGATPSGTFSVLRFRIHGPDNADETFYFDDIMLVK
ncbi:MAG: IPT/TIG domain-containing protein [Chitinophagaceae bacterium]